MPETTTDAGASTTTTTTEANPSDAGAPGGAATPTADVEATKPKPETSANKLIKDFATQRGVTVEALLDRFTELENTGKTELQRLEGERDTFKNEAETYKQQYREVNARVALQDAISNLPNVYDPSTVVDLAVPLLEYDKSGTPTNIEAAIDTLRERRPKLFPAAAGRVDGGAGGDNDTRDINSVFRQMAKSAR